MTTKRKRRNQQFQDGPMPSNSLCVDLLQSAFQLLVAAERERKDLMHMSTHNHHSANAPGAVVMVTTAFDVWMNEVIAALSITGDDAVRALAAVDGIAEKHSQLLRHLGSAPSAQADLQLLADVRNEVVHHLPRAIRDPGDLPSRLEPLREKAVLLEVDHPPSPWGTVLALQLCSYRLAHWAWLVVHGAVQEIVRAETSTGGFAVILASNFDWFRNVTPPEQLPQYDAKHGLKVPLRVDWDRLREQMLTRKP